VQLSFPCESAPSARHAPRLSGPTLNLWASVGAGALAGSCTLTTLSPPVQYKLTPRGFFYGYEINKMRCRLANVEETLGALGSGDGLATSAGRDRAAAAQGLWLVPDRPSVSGGAGPGWGAGLWGAGWGAGMGAGCGAGWGTG
jgi:hypothetical protein